MERIPVQPVDSHPTGSHTIDCDTCVMAHSDVCADCVVSFIVNREPGDALVVDAAEARALKVLGEEGLVPHLRHRTRRVG
jgi:hypothetical protein